MVGQCLYCAKTFVKWTTSTVCDGWQWNLIHMIIIKTSVSVDVPNIFAETACLSDHSAKVKLFTACTE